MAKVFETRVEIVTYTSTQETVAYLERLEPDCDGNFWTPLASCALAEVGAADFAQTVAKWAYDSDCEPVVRHFDKEYSQNFVVPCEAVVDDDRLVAPDSEEEDNACVDCDAPLPAGDACICKPCFEMRG